MWDDDDWFDWDFEPLDSNDKGPNRWVYVAIILIILIIFLFIHYKALP